MDYTDIGNTYEKLPCHIRSSLIREDCQNLDQRECPSKNCKWGRPCYRSKRPDCLESSIDIARNTCFVCKDSDEFVDKSMALCKKRWAAQRRLDIGRKEIRRQLQAQYGKWLCLVWRSGSRHNSNMHGAKEACSGIGHNGWGHEYRIHGDSLQ